MRGEAVGGILIAFFSWVVFSFKIGKFTTVDMVIEQTMTDGV